MRSNTQAVTVPGEPGRVFAFLADPENLPRWAVGFAKSIRPDGDGWVVTTGLGEVLVRYVTDPTTGVIDFCMVSAAGNEAVAFSRVVPNGAGSEYVFTMVQSEGMPDEVFDGQIHALTHELTVLRALLTVECPL